MNLTAADRLTAPVAVALFAIGVPFLKYGAEVKQYQIDATAAILLALLAMPLIDPLPVRKSMRVRIASGAAAVRSYLETIGTRRDQLTLPSMQ